MADVAPPSERIGVGMIGVGMRGQQILGAFNGRESAVVALCDVNRASLAGAFEKLSRKIKVELPTYGDFRRLLDRKDIDAVVVVTPDHWHAAMTVLACRAGKDVYCEKPLAHTIREGRAMVEAARRYGRVVTGGSTRVRGDFGRTADFVASGAIGKLTEAYVGAGGPAGDRPTATEPVPEGLDWDMFVGPAPWVPYSEARYKNWRNYSVFGGGALDDWGAHFYGGFLYALQLDDTGPTEIAIEGRGNARNVVFKFANGVIVHQKGPQRFIGDRGEAGVGKQHPAVVSPLRQYRGKGDLHGDWFHCIRTRERPFQDVEYAHRVASMCHLTEIAMKLGRPLRWDPRKEVFDDEQANRMLGVAMREPWTIG
jgi:hypothetical protein